MNLLSHRRQERSHTIIMMMKWLNVTCEETSPLCMWCVCANIRDKSPHVCTVCLCENETFLAHIIANRKRWRELRYSAYRVIANKAVEECRCNAERGEKWDLNYNRSCKSDSSTEALFDTHSIELNNSRNAQHYASCFCDYVPNLNLTLYSSRQTMRRRNGIEKREI